MTPHLVGLAKQLEDKPFHLLATHCHNGEKDDVVAYVKSKGLSADTTNMTVSSFGGHPKVKGNGYVPYYMVFDHRGQLVHHHMCGDYHGGDGLKMIEIVTGLLDDVPALYLGKEPFEAFPKLAKQVGGLKKLPAALLRIDSQLTATEGEALTAAQRSELERLRAAVDDYRTRMLAAADAAIGTDPTTVLPSLKKLRKHFAGTPDGETISARVRELSASKELATAIKIFKSYRKTMAKLEKGEPTDKRKRNAAKRLTKLIDGHDDLPIHQKVQAAIDALTK